LGNTSDSGVLIPLWQRGIKGDFKIMVTKSPLAPLCLPWQEKDAKEGYKGRIILLDSITEGLGLWGDN
jgi:hypothetical protein